MVSLRVRRFFCERASYPRRTFAEQVPDLSERYRRRSVGLRRWMQAIATLLGGRPGERLSRTLDHAAPAALHRRREQVLRLIDQAEGTARLQEGLAKRAAAVERHEAQIARLKEELEQLGDATYDRDRIIAQVSNRYGDLLREWRHPKLSQPFIKPDLTPFVRGEPYQEASSGARTLLTLAGQLAVFEIAVETGTAHPGFLMIDSPQKNLGHGVGTLDAVIADAVASTTSTTTSPSGWQTEVPRRSSSSSTTARRYSRKAAWWSATAETRTSLSTD